MTELGLEVIGRDGRSGVGADLLGVGGQFAGLDHAAVADLHDDRQASRRRLDVGRGRLLAFVGRQQRSFARAAADVQSAHAAANQVIDDGLGHRQVQRAVRPHGRKSRGNQS